MHKHYSNGPVAVREARERRTKEPVKRMQDMMVWMTYGTIIAWGLFLRAAGLM